MKPEEIDARARTIASKLDEGNVAEASQCFLQDIETISPTDFKNILKATQILEKKGTGLDLAIDPVATNGDGMALGGSRLKLQSKSDTDTFVRDLAIYGDSGVSRVWEPLPAEKQKFLDTETEIIASHLDDSDLEGASARITALLGLTKSLGHADVYFALKKVERNETPAKGFDLTLVEQQVKGEPQAYRSYVPMDIILHKHSGGDSHTRKLGVIDPFSAQPLWQPNKSDIGIGPQNPYASMYFDSPLHWRKK